MTGLLDLAPELLAHIIKSIHIYPLQGDLVLYRLALTCRLLHQVTEPFLYHKIIQPGRKSTRQLLRTILEKPDYVARVKTISLCLIDELGPYPQRGRGYRHGRKSDGDRDDDETREKEIELLISAYEKLDIIETSALSRETWITALKGRKERAIISLLLLSLPNLQKVDIEISSHDRSLFFSHAILAACSPQQERIHLRHVKEVSMNFERPEDCIWTEEIIPMFYLPSLKKISASQVMLNGFEFQPPLSSCPVESIEFMESGVASDAASTLLSVTKELKHLSFGPGSCKYVGMEDQTLISSIAHSLHLVSSTLESLDLGILCYDEDNLASIPSLRDFPKLKKIRVHLACIMSSQNELWEVIPAMIEELHLGTNDICWNKEYRALAPPRDSMVREMVELVLRKEEKFPGLRKVVFEGGDEILRDVCLAKGVEFA